MEISPEIVRTIVTEWIGQRLSEEEAEALATSYETLTETLAAYPQEKLQWVEPALHSAPAPELPEAGR